MNRTEPDFSLVNKDFHKTITVDSAKWMELGQELVVH